MRVLHARRKFAELLLLARGQVLDRLTLGLQYGSQS